jgi:hypothetical protein
MQVVETGLLGAHRIGADTHQLAYVFGTVTNQKLNKTPWLSAIDLDTAKQIAYVASPVPYTIDTTWFDYIQDPTGIPVFGTRGSLFE